MIKTLASPLVSGLLAIGAYVAFVLDIVRLSVSRWPARRLIFDQMYAIGVLSLPVVALTGFCTGMVLAAQAIFQLSDKGLESVTGLMVTKGMLVELGPVLTAFMVTGRVGAAMCAELGTMRVTEQLDAMRSMANNPIRYLVAPRVIAGVVMVPLLTIFSTLAGVLGGYVIAVGFYKLSSNAFLSPLPEQLHNFDFISGMVKALIFGLFIVTISCYRGMNTSGGAAGVGRATTRSVVVCYSVILLANFLVTMGLNNSYYYIQLWFGNGF